MRLVFVAAFVPFQAQHLQTFFRNMDATHPESEQGTTMFSWSPRRVKERLAKLAQTARDPPTGSEKQALFYRAFLSFSPKLGTVLTQPAHSCHHKVPGTRMASSTTAGSFLCRGLRGLGLVSNYQDTDAKMVYHASIKGLMLVTTAAQETLREYCLTFMDKNYGRPVSQADLHRFAPASAAA